MRTSNDHDWDDWKVGDLVKWDDEPDSETFTITSISKYGYVYWNDNHTNEENMTRSTNLVRVGISEMN